MSISYLFFLAFAVALAGSPASAGQPDALRGRETALALCAACHVVEPGQARAPTLVPPAPSFAAIAARPEITAAALRSFLLEPHGRPRTASRMPPFVLPRTEVDSVVTYILGLKAP